MAKTAKTEQEEPLEKKLWKAADKLRKNMDAAEYKHVALGLIFLKYISDAFEEQYQKSEYGRIKNCSSKSVQCYGWCRDYSGGDTERKLYRKNETNIRSRMGE